MHVLVTRPEPDVWQTKAEFEKLGLQVTSAPLLTIAFNDIAPGVFDGASGVVATSKNALRGLALSGLVDKVQPLQVYAVGEETAAFAEDLKLRNITAGRGTAADLVPVIAERHAGRPGPLIHLAGDYLAFDLAGALGEKNIKVAVLTVYRSIAAERLPPGVIGALKSGQINAVTLMSPRTAQIWGELTAKHGLQSELNNIIHVCLSQAVAVALPPNSQRRTEIAVQPKGQEMLALMGDLAAQFGQE
jgi:uroporphyrinogen-III synthase